MEDILKGSKLNSWRIRKASKTFQIQTYLRLRNDDGCTAGWVADETTHGKQHMEKQKLDLMMKISMDEATKVKLIEQMHVMHHINYKINLQIIKSHQNSTACYLALKSPWNLNLLFLFFSPFEGLYKYRLFLTFSPNPFYPLFLSLTHRYMYTNPLKVCIRELNISKHIGKTCKTKNRPGIPPGETKLSEKLRSLLTVFRVENTALPVSTCVFLSSY